MFNGLTALLARPTYLELLRDIGDGSALTFASNVVENTNAFYNKVGELELTYDESVFAMKLGYSVTHSELPAGEFHHTIGDIIYDNNGYIVIGFESLNGWKIWRPL